MITNFVATFDVEEKNFGAQFKENNTDFVMTFDSGSGIYPEYDGPYTVIPKAVSQTLETKEKTTMDDIVVTQIPYVQTSNPQDGYTVTIG